jgi:hypothetical protein
MFTTIATMLPMQRAKTMFLSVFILIRILW